MSLRDFIPIRDFVFSRVKTCNPPPLELYNVPPLPRTYRSLSRRKVSEFDTVKRQNIIERGGMHSYEEWSIVIVDLHVQMFPIFYQSSMD